MVQMNAHYYKEGLSMDTYEGCWLAVKIHVCICGCRAAEVIQEIWRLDALLYLQIKYSRPDILNVVRELSRSAE
jgi:hypothetical protein